MGFELLVGQVVEEGAELLGRQHALVHDHLRRQRADVEHLALAQVGGAAQPVGGVLADQVKLALEGLAVLRRRAVRGDEQLLHVRHGRPRRLANDGVIRAHRQRPPAKADLARILDHPTHQRLAAFALRRIRRQENDAGPVAAQGRQFGSQVLACGPLHEAMRHAEQNAGPVAGVLLVAQPAPMLHAAVHRQRGFDDLPAWPALDVANEADAATVLLKRRIVQAPLGRQPAQGHFPSLAVTHRGH